MLNLARQDTASRLQTHAAPRRRLAALWRLARREPLGGAGISILVTFFAFAILADVVTRNDPYQNFAREQLIPPSFAHPMGTDHFGRDVYSRIVYGARISLTVSSVAVAIGLSIGLLLGLCTGYSAGRWVDTVLQRVVDAMMALPTLILAIALMALLGAGLPQVMVAIGVTRAPLVARVMRGAVIAAREYQYVEAARVVGGNDLRILFVHILPNVTAPLIVLATLGLGDAIMVETTLSFLGYGAPPPIPSWGAMLGNDARRFMEIAPWTVIFPGLAVSLTVLSFNFVGDSLRDLMDPQLRQSQAR